MNKLILLFLLLIIDWNRLEAQEITIFSENSKNDISIEWNGYPNSEYEIENDEVLSLDIQINSTYPIKRVFYKLYLKDHDKLTLVGDKKYNIKTYNETFYRIEEELKDLLYGENVIEIFTEDVNGNINKSQKVFINEDYSKIKHFAFFFLTSEFDDPGYKTLNNSIIGGVELAKCLNEEFGFDTTVYRNLDLFSTMQKLEMINELAGENDQVLIYFSSHGYLNKNSIGFIATKDSDIKQEYQTHLSHSNLAQLVNNFKSKHILLIIDACFSGTFSNPISQAYSKDPTNEQANSTNENEKSEAMNSLRNMNFERRKSVREFISKKLKNKSRLYLTSGTDKTPTGLTSQSSPFTRTIVTSLRNENAMKDGVIYFGEFLSTIENYRLQPEPRAGRFSGDMLGDFVFISKELQY